MTRTKLWRLSLAAILGFGWLFLTPASYSDDPLSIAAQEIAELNEKVGNLNEEQATQDLIDIAESKYDSAVAAKTNRDNKIAAYDAAVQAQATALSEKTAAQNAVDGQTVTVATALTNKNNAQDDLDVATINLNTANSNLQTAQSAVNNAGSAGLQYTVYELLRDGYLNGQHLAVPGSVICNGVLNSNSMNLPVCGRYEDFIVKLTGVITVPSWFSTTYFAGYTDDGFRMYVNGNLAVDNWVEQGATWSPMSPVYDVSQDKTLNVEIWWYNGGGPGSYHLGWAIPGGWTGAGCDFAGSPRVWGQNFSCNLNTFSYGPGPTQQQLDTLAAAQLAKTAAQQDYDTKLATRNTKVTEYNTANSTLSTYNQTLTTKTTAYNTAVSNTATALTNKNNAIAAYDQAIIDMNDAIDDAWDSYNSTWKEEEAQRVQAAIALAAANQPQPTQPAIDPTPEVSPEPTPEQTLPVDPTPEPSSDTTDEATPDPTPTPELSPEPSQEPSPQATDITQDPTPEPTASPDKIPDKTINAPVDEQTANLIADLTNSNTLTKLSPEQKMAVAGALGIRAEEIAKVAELAKSNEAVAKALEQFGDRANANLDAPLPYTLADATTEVAAENLLADPIGTLLSIDLNKVLNPSEWGKDMTDDQREKAQEVIVPVIIASNLVAAAMTRRI